MTDAPKGPETPDPQLSAQERELGMDSDITRRDFLNAVALGTGAALLGTAAPGLKGALAADPSADRDPPWHPWTGYGGVGDYARSNGNTWEVVNAGHGIRDGMYERAIAAATPTGETYDLVIVGGGFAGAISAYRFLKATQRQRPCLILEDHPIIGGEAKRNEFLVRGQRLIGPQGSNESGVPREPGWHSEMWKDIGMPTEFEFGKLAPSRRPMEFPLDNYAYQLWVDNFENHGYYFDNPAPHWVRNPWGHNLEGTPWRDDVRRDLLRWRDEPAEPWKGDQASLQRWLDTMTYDQYLTNVRKFHPAVARFADPLMASGAGLGSDSLSAFVPYYFGYPGFKGLPGYREWVDSRKLRDLKGVFSFPGGNDAVMRAIVKWLNPEVIDGSRSFTEVHNGRIRFEAMDRPNTPCRMRAGATVVRVDHDPEHPGNGEPATITYITDGKLFSVRARTVIWAGACWTAKYAVQHLPEEYRTAMASFPRSPMLVVNVALDNWRALYKLGYTACSWRGGFGYTANLRAPMYVGDYRPPLDPDQPTIFTFYVPFNQYGLSLVDQGKAARQKMFATSYREYETQIRQQLVTLFASAGFDPKRDIAGIVLNRWGHAYVNAAPGFFFAPEGKSTPSDVLRRPLGNLTFAHSELSGHQNMWAAAEEGKRAAEQITTIL